MPESALLSKAQIMEWARDLYADGVDRKDAQKFARAFTAGGTCQFANNPSLVGRDAIEAGIAQFFTLMAGVSHETVGNYYVDGLLILEARVTYTLHHGGTVTVPAVSIYSVTAEGDPARPAAQECRIYVDLAPLFAAITQPAS